jgi:3-dehydroquinate dehydratase-1
MLCVSIKEDSAEKILTSMTAHDFFEIRLDDLDLTDDELENIFSKDIKTIATCRPGYLDHKTRSRILKKAAEFGADYIDIEVDSSSEYIKEIMEVTKKYGRKVILSYHNEDGVDNLQLLFDIITHAKEFGPDIVKIACKVDTTKECVKLMALYSYFEDIIVIAMGEHGKISRIAAHSLGAPFMYCSSDDESIVAAGQLTLEKHKELKRLIDEA